MNYNENPSNKYYLDSTELVPTESEKDLGFNMDVKFDFGEHIKASLAKANKMIAWVSRTPRFGNWELILSIEKIQRKFTRLVNDIGTLSYGDRLKSLHLTTLAERRMRGDLIETFKILRGLVNYGQGLFRSSEFQDQVLIWFLEGIKSAEADKISLVKELSITGIICLTMSSYLLVLIVLNVAWKRISRPT